MRRADRLFQIVAILRRGRVTTAAQLAAEIEVSERTIYRDVADLIANGVPIEGEAGVGYALPKAFDLPPLMFDAVEIEALVVGARMVASWADDDLARAAGSALRKVENVLPERLRGRVGDTRVFAPDFHVPRGAHAALGTVRAALEGGRVLAFDYESETGERTKRRVHPLGVFFWGRAWTLAAWCTTRDAFRAFRIDRVRAARVLDERFEAVPGRTLEDYVKRAAKEGERTPTRTSAAPLRASARKTPKLNCSPEERAALRAAGVRAVDVGDLDPRELGRRTGGAVPPARCEELVALADFQRLGSVGLETARDFVNLGFRRVGELAGQDPVDLFRRLKVLTRSAQDPCVEDVFRCAIAQAEEPDLRAEWRDWWHWTPLRERDSRARPDSHAIPTSTAGMARKGRRA